MEAKAHQPSSPGISVRFFSDAQLLSQCRIDQYRGSGPGGQKRNKTSNAVRLTHLPTGIQATATESRSLAENKLYVLRRLRLKLAIELREAIDPVKFEPPDWLLAIRTPSRIDISHRHPHYVAAAGLILDLLKVMGGNPGHVAKMLGVSTTAVIKFLETEPQLWAAANSICKELDRPPLQHRN